MIQHWHSHVVSVYTCFDVYLCARVCVCVYACVSFALSSNVYDGLMQAHADNKRACGSPFSLFFPNNTLYTHTFEFFAIILIIAIMIIIMIIILIRINNNINNNNKFIRDREINNNRYYYRNNSIVCTRTLFTRGPSYGYAS